ncbi:Pentatricopeptide repeat-containing protein [Thalictrum thalictroides]|uniref:Pentatricopeptide repeat-containing protein n=1 Tax=Thalictrum thalictroides TaxID=46969 RepID=A0A7J6WXB0_THATH|nr:Pentatricopeptide repeat-containing protein [Thalictrum thalictroides]
MDFNRLFHLSTKTHIAKRLHALLVVSGEAHNIFFSTRLVNLYANLGDIALSRQAFDLIPTKNIFSWNSMISSFVKNGCFQNAIHCYYQLLTTRVRPDFFTFPVVLKACGCLSDGKKIHSWVFKMGFCLDLFVAASLIHMYSRFALVGDARNVFDEMITRDLGSWNAMISGFCQNGKAAEALDVFREMCIEGVKMDSVTVSSILPVCAPLNDLVTGMLIHVYVIKHGLAFDVYVSNALLNMYAKFGSLELARKVFDQMLVRDLVSWNSLIAAYEQNHDPITALGYFIEMKQKGFQPDVLTLVSLASIVSQSGNVRNSRSVHCFIMKRGFIAEDIFVGNAVVDMYAKLGNIDYARKVFEAMDAKDVISWNSLITCYTQNSLASEAMEIYNTMRGREKIVPDQGTLVSILPAYSHVGALQQGMKIHGFTIKVGLQADIYVGTCLIDVYAKCGRLNDAMLLFGHVPRRSSVPWNAIIAGHGIHGHGEKSLYLFEQMQEEGVKPDHVTFVSVLSACSHAGLVDRGQQCFKLMRDKYFIEPGLKHYGCMVDLLGRAGQLEMAYEFIKNMHVRPDASVWGALLGACRIHGNVELGTIVSDRLFEVDSENVGYYVLLSNIYANVGKWEGVDKVRSLAKNRGLKKTPGWSSIEVNNRVDVFYTANRSHPQSEAIYKELKVLMDKMKNIGYVPDYSFVLQDVEEDEKEQILSSHSERLAIAYGIITTPPKATIHIFKNLRVCGDCHNATKYISKITEREIVVRDSNRFHHFKDGDCSCGDYW